MRFGQNYNRYEFLIRLNYNKNLHISIPVLLGIKIRLKATEDQTDVATLLGVATCHRTAVAHELMKLCRIASAEQRSVGD